jgi:iron complex transport system substrate-binding protein
LADAKYDGEINPLDFVQIKLIIVGKEKELTLIDAADRIVTVKKPIERIFITSHYLFEGVQILGSTDKVVGVTRWIPKQYHLFIPEVKEIPVVGYKDYEAILSLNPDLVNTFKSRAEEAAEKLPGVAVVSFDLGKQKRVQEEMMKLGYVLDKEDEAKHYIDDFRGKYIDYLRARTKGLSEEERPKVYVEAFGKPYKTYSGTYDEWLLVEIAGGRDIFADIGSGTTIDPEAVVYRNPDIIIKKTKRADAGYEFDIGDTSKIKAIRDEVMNRPELAEVAAVKEGRVYAIYGDLTYGLDHPMAMAYYAKFIQPDLFKDLDSKVIHQEYLTELMGADYDLDKHGVFVYPPLES